MQVGLIGYKTVLLIKDVIGITAFWGALIMCQYFLRKNRLSSTIIDLDKKSFEIYLYSEPLNYIVLYCCVLIGGWCWGDSSLFIIRFIFTWFGSLLLARIIKLNYGQKPKR